MNCFFVKHFHKMTVTVKPEGWAIYGDCRPYPERLQTPPTYYNRRLSSAVSGRSVGKFVGFGSLSDLLVGLSMSMAAIVTGYLPWVTSTEVLWFMYFLLGTTLGLVNIAGQHIILSLWLDKAASPMHIVHLGYGVGGFIAPLLVNPYLANLPEEETTDTPTPNTSFSHDVTTFMYNGTSVTMTFHTESRIQFAYYIVAAITAVFALVFLVYQFDASRQRFGSPKTTSLQKSPAKVEKNESLQKKRTFLQMINPATCADGSLIFGLFILLPLFLRYFFLTGLDRELGTFLYSYAVDQLDFTKDDATLVNTVFWINYAVGRLVVFLVAFFVSIKVILVVESVGALITGIFMVVFALDEPLSLWILAGCSGFLLGPMYPSGIAWGNAHIEMTGLAITCTLLGSAFGGLAFIRFGGFAYDKYGPSSMAYIFLVSVTLISMFDFFLTVFGRCKQKITGKSESEEKLKEITTNGADVQIEIKDFDSKKGC
ncbi:hypothetical protein FSP39_014850 [Pinctada imbricata]|uniref:Uncharacterized protein n=1 Tax=Pinctada imbricata TaxID=66713 RepID=A0AA89CC55_PINIB|nr:hypothetical protein FSP39_014850 [Pinctada imbricata]